MNKFIQVRHSVIHGRGVFARQFIAKGTHIIEYTGNKISKHASEKILTASQGDAAVYIFDLTARHDLDGNVAWNAARYINHACNPNCESENIEGKIWIIALKDIQQGEELSYDYHFMRPGWDERPCLCNSDKCFGYIVSKKHRSAIRKTKRYQLAAEKVTS